MPDVACQICSKLFYVKPNRLRRGWGKYCSNGCKNKGFRTGKILSCAICHKEIYKGPRDQQRSMSGKLFCGKSCQTIWRNNTYIGKKHANWKGGESSYKQIMQRAGIPGVCKKCKTIDSRILAVHHRDRNRKNNELSNLVWLCHNCHFLVHHYKNEAGKFLVPVA